MSVTTSPEPRYDRITIALHWAVVMLVALLWGIAQIIDLFPRGPLRVDARSLHIVLGLLLAGVMILRIVWRAGAGRALPPASDGVMQTIANAVHYALYALVSGEVLLGMANAWVRGDSIFGLFSLPGFAPLGEIVGDLHAIGANLILLAAGAHAAAALLHHFILRDGVLLRMVPPQRRR